MLSWYMAGSQDDMTLALMTFIINLIRCTKGLEAAKTGVDNSILSKG